MNRYSIWKYLVIAAVVAIGALYALPNLFGEDPAVQVSPARGSVVDESLRLRVEGLLKGAGLAAKSIEVENGLLLARFEDTEVQLTANDMLRDALANEFVVALNLAPSTPAWLTALNARPMYLGLDLRGGVHFLMEVDMDAAERMADERYVNDIRTLLRDQKLRYVQISRRSNGGIEATFRSVDERDAAEKAITKEFLTLVVGAGDDTTLAIALGEKETLEVRRAALQQNITTLRNRVNELGVAEPIIQQQGGNRIVVQLPGVQDTARAKEILGATATLEFRLVDTKHEVQDAVGGRVPAGSRLYYERNGSPVLLDRRVIITGESIIDAASGIDQTDGSPAVFITLDAKGARRMSDVTKDNIGNPMAVVFMETKTETAIVDGEPVKTKKKIEEVISVATIRDQLSKRFQITGLESAHEARNLALLLRAGALSVPMEIIEERTVGPSMGAENIAKGFNSTLIGFAAIALFMSIYYRVFGVIASVALFVNIVLLIAVLSMLQATLTLPGIAGIALTVGMAIDANVLVFERIREELRNGNSIQAAIHSGYERAWDTIFDSNITTLIAGVALFWLGSGPVRGFAVTLCIGIVTSMFSAVMVSRAMVNLMYGQRKLARLPI